MSANTRLKILAEIKRSGYAPDPILRALSACRRGLSAVNRGPRIAFLSSHRDRASFLRFEHMRSFLMGAERQGESMGYACDLVCVGAWQRRQPLQKWLKDQGYEGLILGPLHPAQRLPSLNWSDFEVVKIDSRFHGPKTSFVSNDQLQVVRVALQRLRALGYRRIGLAVGEVDEVTTNHLYQTALVLAQSHWVSAEHTRLFLFGLRESPAQARARLIRWMNEEVIDALLINRHDARSLLASCPRRIAVAMLSLPDGEREFSGIRQNHEQVGRLAMERLAAVLLDRRLGGSQEPIETYVEGTWYEGRSTPAKESTQ